MAIGFTHLGLITVIPSGFICYRYGERLTTGLALALGMSAYLLIWGATYYKEFHREHIYALWFYYFLAGIDPSGHRIICCGSLVSLTVFVVYMYIYIYYWNIYYCQMQKFDKPKSSIIFHWVCMSGRRIPYTVHEHLNQHNQYWFDQHL